VTRPDNATDTEPAWAPDWGRIAFVRTTGLASCCPTANLDLIGADGAGERRLTDYDSGAPIPVNAPAWSPKGRQIVFLRGGKRRQRRPDPARRVGPAEDRQTWVSTRSLVTDGRPPRLWADRPAKERPERGLALTVEPLQGRTRRVPLEPSAFLEGASVWSPSGKTLVYASYSSENDFELFSITPLGHGLRQLTRNRRDDFDPA